MKRTAAVLVIISALAFPLTAGASPSPTYPCSPGTANMLGGLERYDSTCERFAARNSSRSERVRMPVGRPPLATTTAPLPPESPS